MRGNGSPQNYYQILGLDRSATSSQIKKAYRRLAKQYHPDQAKIDLKEAEEKFKQISNAYSILSDPQKKLNYDRFGTVDNFTQGVQFTSFSGKSKRTIIEQKLSNGQDFDYFAFASELGVNPINLLKIILKLVKVKQIPVQVVNARIKFS